MRGMGKVESILENGHHDVKGHVFIGVEVRWLKNSSTGEMESYEFNDVFAWKADQIIANKYYCH